MPMQYLFQLGLVDIGLRKHLLDARLILGAANARGNGYDVFGAKNLGGHAFVIHMLRFAHCFIGESIGGEKLHGKPADN